MYHPFMQLAMQVKVATQGGEKVEQASSLIWILSKLIAVCKHVPAK